MSESWTESAGIVLRCLATALSGPTFMANAIALATLGVAEDLLGLCSQGLTLTVRQLREEGLKRIRAGTRAKEADADKRVAEATEAANRSALQLRNDRISRAEEKLKLAEVAKATAEAARTQAEADAIRAESEAQSVRERSEALVRLMSAISVFNEKGGQIAIDPDGLKKLLEVSSPAVLESKRR